MIKFLQILAVNLPLVGGQNIYSEAAQLEAKQHLALLAENDVVLGTATTASALTEYHHTKSGGALGGSKKTTLDTYQNKTQVGTTLGGGDILVSAGNDLKAKNLQAIADKDLHLQAVNNVSISADTNYFKETHFEQKSKSGVFSGGGIGITFGKKSETHESEAEGWQQSQARSTLGSLSGNVSVKAGNHAHLSGTDLIASKELDKAITIEGKSTYIGASEDELSSKERHEYKQSGLTIAFSSAVTDAAMAVQSSLKRSEQVKDERLDKLLKVKAVNEAIETVDKAKKLIDTLKDASNLTQAAGNQKLEKQDLTKAQERQEMAQTIGQISEDWLQFTVGDKLEEADKKRQEADAIEKENPTKATALRTQAQAIEAEYGLGSNLQMGVRAATAALQGLATGNVNQAAVGAASPYLNKLIKEQTGDNKEANLIAHAVLGAVEAHFTGNNAAAGALGALTAEVAAPLIMQTLYGTEKPENLTDSQKQNVANLSQIAAGLSGGLVGDSTKTQFDRVLSNTKKP